MAISDQIGRLTTLRNNIRSKLINLGILPAASTSATLSECYNVLSSVTGLSAMSYTPTTTAQTIASGQYLKGAQTINAIPSAYIVPTGTSTVTSNSVYDIRQYASVSVNVQPALQSKTVTPTQAVQSVTPDTGIYGLSKVTVNAIPSAYVIPSGTITLSSSGTFDVGSYASADVTVTGGPSEFYMVADSVDTSGIYCYNVSKMEYVPSSFFYYKKLLSYETFSYIKSVYSYGFCRTDFTAVAPNSLTFMLSNSKALGYYGFSLAELPNEIHFPYIETLSSVSGAFYNAKGVKKVFFESLEVLYDSAESLFMNCFSLQEFYAPMLRRILSPNVFYGCWGLSLVSCPMLIEITGSNVFATCQDLSTVSFPLLTRVAASAFSACYSLNSFSFPNLTTMTGGYIFWNCYSLNSAIFPKLTDINLPRIFYGCSSLSLVSFSVASRISGSAVFSYCRNLISMFFLSTSICTLRKTVASTFSTTPISTYSESAYRYGSIYVPQSLLASYKAATNWTTVSSKIFAYESYFGTIGSFGYVDPTWTPFYEEQIDPEFLIEYGNGWQDNVGMPLDDYGENHCIIEFDGVVYPLATYSSNAIRFGAPISGTSSYKWDYYPFHVNCDEGTIVCQTSKSHTFKMYSQLP